MTIAATVDANGISAPQYSDILTYLKTQYRAIFGGDVYLESDSQDGQFLAIVASAINDSNAAAVAIYNSFSPSTAQGNGLSSTVKINGIARLVASKSSAIVTLGGTAGTTINAGVVSDGTNQWDLPASVTIPTAGEISVTATAREEGAIAAPPGTIAQIATPVFGWSTVTNAAAASWGEPVEPDAALRVRQRTSVALPSVSVLEGMVGAVSNLAGVSRVKAYENDSNATDSNGLPEHSVALVVQGGNTADVAAAIAIKKTPGSYLYGTTAVSVIDDYGLSQTVRFSAPALVPIAVEVGISALGGYTTSIAEEIKSALVAYIESLGIGAAVMIPRLYVPAQLSGSANSKTYEITSLEAAAKPDAVGTVDIPIAFNELATLALADITITVA